MKQNQILFGTAENDAVQALLARYLQKRLQGTQLSTLPPPAVLFNSRHQAKVRQAAQKGSTTNSGGLTRNSHPSSNYKDNRKHREDYEDDYVDDLQGFEDSDRSRTRIDLLAGKSFNMVLFPLSVFSFSVVATRKKEGELDETRLIDSP
ncbi:low affinity immunoglobulin epsilon Fc receptor-like isoform X2 [Vespula maculifrons]|uniref:Low affinity immunoglobulin epsilon Fc receptor-like isoform X2 n=1 Tax=Vespula maculifrons TaxID=7453 RepID=A0ABD2B6Y9_VESMC